jgi:hypothetical protein
MAADNALFASEVGEAALSGANVHVTATSEVPGARSRWCRRALNGACAIGRRTQRGPFGWGSMLVRNHVGATIGPAILLCGGLLLGDGSRGGAMEDIEAKWRREYPLAAPELEQVARSVFAKGSYVDRPMHGETVAINDLTVASLGKKRLIVFDGRQIVDPPPKKTRPTVVRCQTDDYVFSLVRRQPDGPYFVTNYSKGEDDPGFEMDFCICARSATVYFGASLLERMQRASFVLKAAALVQDGGAELVRIDYVQDGDTRSESGAVYIDPRLGWAIRKVDITIQEKELTPKGKAKLPMAFTSDVEYQEVGNNAHFPRRVESFLRTARPDVYQHARVELSQIRASDVPEDIFRLTAYGLPELPLRPIRATPAFSFRNPLFWVALAGMVVSLAVLWRTRHKSDRSSAPSAL